MNKVNTIITRIKLRAIRNRNVTALLLQGSEARGTAQLDSDIDFFFLMKQGYGKKYKQKIILGKSVDIHAADKSNTLKMLKRRADLCYGFVDGVQVFERGNDLKEVIQFSVKRLKNWRIQPSKRKEIVHWLESTRLKLKAATKAKDSKKANFLCSVNLWQILEGVFAVNGKPIPPQGAVRDYLLKLNLSKGMMTNIDRLVSGSSKKRVESGLKIIGFCLGKLR